MADQIWALFDAHDEDRDLYGSCVIGPAPAEKEEFLRGFEMPLAPLELTMTFRAMFDHEPTDKDKDRYAPEGHRSWENADD